MLSLYEGNIIWDEVNKNEIKIIISINYLKWNKKNHEEMSFLILKQNRKGKKLHMFFRKWNIRHLKYENELIFMHFKAVTGIINVGQVYFNK